MSDDKNYHGDVHHRSRYPDRRPNEPAVPAAGPEGDDPPESDNE